VGNGLTHKAGTADRGLAGAHAEYLLREKECSCYISNLGGTKDEIKQAWCDIEDRDLAQRKDARFQSRLIVPIPNDLSDGQKRYFLQELVRRQFSDLPHLAVLHAGKSGEPQENAHVHIAFNGRKISDGKKSRKIIKKEWLLGEMQTDIEAILRDLNVAVGKTQYGSQRVRLPRPAYELHAKGQSEKITAQHTYGMWLGQEQKKLEMQWQELLDEKSEIHQALTGIATRLKQRDRQRAETQFGWGLAPAPGAEQGQEEDYEYQRFVGRKHLYPRLRPGR